jgi:hypothetical protein
MGMFDEIRCKYPLPDKRAQDLEFQTQDTEQQFMDDFEIREDGTLWHQDYTTEDRSDPNEKGIFRMFGCMTRVPTVWSQVKHTGEIRFYAAGEGEKWFEFSSYFIDGKLKELVQISPKEDNA